MLRIAGAIMVFAASSVFGISAAETYRKGALQLEAFHRLIVYTARQIDGFLAPLDRIYAEYEDSELEKCGILEALRCGMTAEAFDGCRCRLYMSDDEAAEVKAFFTEVGRYTAEEESRHLAYFEKTVGELAAKARAELPAKLKLGRAFGMLFGIMAAVILL